MAGMLSFREALFAAGRCNWPWSRTHGSAAILKGWARSQAQGRFWSGPATVSARGSHVYKSSITAASESTGAPGAEFRSLPQGSARRRCRAAAPGALMSDRGLGSACARPCARRGVFGGTGARALPPTSGGNRAAAGLALHPHTRHTLHRICSMGARDLNRVSCCCGPTLLPGTAAINLPSAAGRQGVHVQQLVSCRDPGQNVGGTAGGRGGS